MSAFLPTVLGLLLLFSAAGFPSPPADTTIARYHNEWILPCLQQDDLVRCDSFSVLLESRDHAGRYKTLDSLVSYLHASAVADAPVAAVAIFDRFWKDPILRDAAYFGYVLRQLIDGGNQWQPVEAVSEGLLSGVSFGTGKSGVLFGLRLHLGNSILHTGDGGVSWVPASMPATDNTIWDVHYRNDVLAWAIDSDGDLIRTLDGGRTWARQQLSGVDTGSRFELRDIHFSSGCRGAGRGLLHARRRNHLDARKYRAIRKPVPGEAPVGIFRDHPEREEPHHPL